MMMMISLSDERGRGTIQFGQDEEMSNLLGRTFNALW